MKGLMIIDHNLPDASQLEKILSAEAGYRLYSASDGRQAGRTMKDHDIQLVLINMESFGHAGLQLPAVIRMAGPHVGVVLITSAEHPAQVADTDFHPCFGYLLKPYDSRQVLFAVALALRLQEIQSLGSWNSSNEYGEYDRKMNLPLIAHGVEEAAQQTGNPVDDILSEQQSLFQGVLETIPHSVYYKNIDGIYLGCNAAFAEFLNKATRDIIGKSTAEFASAGTVQRTRLAEEELVRTRKKVTYDISLTDHAGNKRDMMITKALFYDSRHEPAGIVSSMLDITERKQNEQAYRDAEQKIRQIMDNLHIGVALIDADLHVVEMNRQIRQWFGPDLRNDEMPICYHLFYGNGKPATCDDCVVRNTFQDGQTREVKKSMTRNGVGYEYRVISSPIIDEAGAVASVIYLFEDITEKIVMERELMQSQKLASIGQLAAGVAHEINNPTGFVSSNLKTLNGYQKDLIGLVRLYQELKAMLRQGDGSVNGSAVAAMLEAIEANEDEIDIEYLVSDIGALIAESVEGGERIKRIVDDLKRFAHPGQDKVQDTDINAGLISTLNIVNNEVKYKATVVQDFGELPIISANPQQLNQVFANILVNAAQAIDTKGEIIIKTRLVGEKVEIRISDNGCGIAKENLSRIFDPFFTTKEVGKGTGLGMNIVYNIIQKHNGSIQVKSRIGKGTTFIIQLPANQATGLGDGTGQLIAPQQDLAAYADGKI